MPGKVRRFKTAKLHMDLADFHVFLADFHMDLGDFHVFQTEPHMELGEIHKLPATFHMRRRKSYIRRAAAHRRQLQVCYAPRRDSYETGQNPSAPGKVSRPTQRD